MNQKTDHPPIEEKPTSNWPIPSLWVVFDSADEPIHVSVGEPEELAEKYGPNCFRIIKYHAYPEPKSNPRYSHAEFEENKTRRIDLKKARLVTLDQILEDILPLYFNPLPPRDTVRTWLDGAGVARFKINPTAQRGGGRVWYSAAGVEKFIKGRTFGGTQ
jgi:hypothetical protein